MFNPLISIIIPVYNGQSFLNRCFSTLEKQNYNNLEIIFIDNNSNDNSKEIIQDYCKRKKSWKIINCLQQGPGFARNKGLNEAKGEYISFLDIDDEIHPDKHDILLNTLINNPEVNVVLGQTEKIYENKSTQCIDYGRLEYGLNIAPEPAIFWLQHFQHHPHISSALIKRDILSKHFHFPENILYGEDGGFLVKIGMTENIFIVEKIIHTYYRHDSSAISVANQTMSRRERYFKFYEKFALPYFFNNINIKSYKSAFRLSEYEAFKILIALIYKEGKSEYHASLYEQNSRYRFHLFKKIRKTLFSYFPFKFAYYIYNRLVSIYFYLYNELH